MFHLKTAAVVVELLLVVAAAIFCPDFLTVAPSQNLRTKGGFKRLKGKGQQLGWSGCSSEQGISSKKKSTCQAKGDKAAGKHRNADTIGSTTGQAHTHTHTG